MPAKFRIPRADFKRMRGFKRLHGRFFSLSYGELPGRTAPGAATVVSKGVAARAVKRNLIKRRARSVLAKCLKNAGPIAYVLIAKKGADSATFPAIQADIQELVARSAGAR